MTNDSKGIQTLTLQNQSKQRIINVLGRLDRFFSDFGTERASSEAEKNGFMKNLKNYLLKNSEQMLALVILVGVPAIAHLVPYKLVFLNFFFIVILFSVYFVEAHKALMGGVLTTLLVAIFVYYFPSSFVPTFTELDLWMNILAWSSFLILTGGAVGKLADRLKLEIKDLRQRKGDLETQIDHLEAELAHSSALSRDTVKAS